MYAFLNANNFRKKIWESNQRISDEQDVVFTSSEIQLSQIFVSKVLFAFQKKSVLNDVVGILVTCESS